MLFDDLDRYQTMFLFWGLVYDCFLCDRISQTGSSLGCGLSMPSKILFCLARSSCSVCCFCCINGGCGSHSMKLHQTGRRSAASVAIPHKRSTIMHRNCGKGKKSQYTQFHCIQQTFMKVRETNGSPMSRWFANELVRHEC